MWQNLWDYTVVGRTVTLLVETAEITTCNAWNWQYNKINNFFHKEFYKKTVQASKVNGFF